MAGNLVVDTINSKDISSSLVATESQVIGVGQTWQDVTGSRAVATTYTNSTGKPIEISVSFYSTSPHTAALYINNAVIWAHGIASNDAHGTAIIPDGATYRIEAAYQTYTWKELR